MKVTAFTQWWPPEPANVVGSLLAEMAHRGHSVQVVTGFPNYPTGKIYPGYRLRGRQVDEGGGIRTIRVPLYPSHDRSAVGRVLNYISFGLSSTTIGLASVRSGDVAYVYHPTLMSAWPARVQRLLQRTPFVLHVQDLWPDSVISSGMMHGRVGAWAEKVLHRMCNATYQAARHIVVISPGFKRVLTERGVPEEKITVVLNWADDGVFAEGPVDANARAEMGPLDRRIVLYAGNLGHYQGLDTVIRAAAEVETRTRIHLTIVGDGVAKDSLRELVRELNARNVTLLRRRPASDVVTLLASADAHLVCLADLPFFAHTIPGKTSVAFASGKFVIMAARGDAARLVDDAGAGITCAPSEECIIDAFERFDRLAEDEIVARGKVGRDYYETHLSLRHGVDTIETILKRAARGL